MISNAVSGRGKTSVARLIAKILDATPRKDGTTRIVNSSYED